MPEIINKDNLPIEFCKAEIEEYEKATGKVVEKAEFTDLGDGNCKEKFWHVPIRFQRLRRITGYLVGTMDRWNDAKKAEERDRVKHA